MKIIYWLVTLIVILLIWQVSTHQIEILPTPYKVGRLLILDFEMHLSNITQTASEAFLGLVLASLISGAIILLVGVLPTLEKYIEPLIVILKTSPAIAFAPIVIILFGSGFYSKVITSLLICFFPLVIGGLDGIRRTPDSLNQIASVYGASPIRKFLNINIGYALDGFLSGLKVASPLSVVGAIVGEYVIGANRNGLGSFLVANVYSNQKASVFAAAILATGLGLIFYLVASTIYKIYDSRLFIRN